MNKRIVNVITFSMLRFWCDRDSALQVDQRVQKGLFLFAVANSCVNPMVYGFFSRRPARNRSQSRHEFQRKVIKKRCATGRLITLKVVWLPCFRDCPTSQPLCLTD